MHVVAIDGPSGSGKSTVARAVAARLGLEYLDSGAMYRAVAFLAIRHGVDPDDSPAVIELARAMDLRMGDNVIVDGVDATIEIRSPEVTRAVSAVAAIPEVRNELVLRQREWVEGRGGAVVEGRDIGSVVFPGADLKVYLTADDAERASRRSKEMLELEYDQVAADMAKRDQLDSTRASSPLLVAPDAVYIDTTDRDIADVVDEVSALAERTVRG
jgi:cytidylate kinase